MADTGWDAKLHESTDEDDVAAICNLFLRSWTVEQLAELPPLYRPGDVIEAGAIVPYAIRLIAAVGVGNRSTDPVLYGMSTFFTKAALRIAEFRGVVARQAPQGNSGWGPGHDLHAKH